MTSFPLLPIFLLVGLSLALIKNEARIPSHHGNRNYRNNENHRALRTLVGSLLDTETNALYNIASHQKQKKPLNIDTPDESNLRGSSYGLLQETACLDACYACLEDYPINTFKKKAADNCGPMCDCADSCSRKPIEEINATFGQSEAVRGDKDCFWRTYSQALKYDFPSVK